MGILCVVVMDFVNSSLDGKLPVKSITLSSIHTMRTFNRDGEEIGVNGTEGGGRGREGEGRWREVTGGKIKRGG